MHIITNACASKFIRQALHWQEIRLRLCTLETFMYMSMEALVALEQSVFNIEITSTLCLSVIKVNLINKVTLLMDETMSKI